MLHKIFNFLKSIVMPSSILQLLKQLLFLTLIGILATSIFFYIYLPIATNHGDTLTVPNITGVHVDDLDDYLSLRSLRYEISVDSGYSSEIPPLTVLKQFPMPNAQVKEFRKIYITLNSMAPPMVKMPDLTNGSLKNALMILKNFDLTPEGIINYLDLHINQIQTIFTLQMSHLLPLFIHIQHPSQLFILSHCLFKLSILLLSHHHLFIH